MLGKPTAFSSLPARAWQSFGTLAKIPRFDIITGIFSKTHIIIIAISENWYVDHTEDLELLLRPLQVG
jgi:hypothetical protein